MKTREFKLLAVSAAIVCAFISSTFAGTFKHITIDGSFGDWAGVPVTYTQAQDTTNAVAYNALYIANDENYLYLRFSIYGTNNPFTSLENIFIDSDNNLGTGYGAHGLIGSEMLIQGGTGYQEKNGTFNEGPINGLDWQAAPIGTGTEFELRISRNATYASDSTPVFANDTLALVLESDNSSYANIEWFPPTAGATYTFEAPPSALSTNLSLVDLSNSSWQVNASGTDLSTNWLDQAYDDSQSPWISGLGIFGYTSASGAYPIIQTPLSAGPNTYYFRNHFNWNYETANLAFVATNYLSDGAVYYLNGAEVRRVRMPSGTITYNTSASGTNSPQGHADIFGFSGDGFLIGDNVLEVETHQAPASSSDMVFGMSLTAATEFPVMIVDTNLPADQTVVGGQPVTFSADILGSGPLNYQWFKNGSPIADATNAIYMIPLVLTNDVGGYSLRVANSFATNTTREAHLTVNSTPIVINDSAQPVDQVVVEGHPVTFNVVASGSALVQYQWYQGADPILGETNASYSIASAAMTNSGSYHVMVSNPADSTNSRSALLTVLSDTISPSVTGITASPGRIVITFSEPIDPTTANNPVHYSLNGGGTISDALVNPNDTTQVTLTMGSPLTLNTLYSLTINGVNDLFNNSTVTTVSLAPTIAIDGNFDDWQGITPIYSGPSGLDGAADFENIYMYDDANSYYFRVTLYHDIPSASGHFPAYVNMFFNTDGDPNTGYTAVGSDLLIQSGFGYQEKNGAFNEGGINGLNFLSLPAAPGADFEFSFSKAAMFASDHTPVITTNVLTFLFQGMNTGYVAINSAPSDGGTLSYTNTTSVNVPALPIGGLSIASVPGGNAAIVWDSPAMLQVTASLQSSWTNLPTATSPYIIPSSVGQQFFRLKQ